MKYKIEKVGNFMERLNILKQIYGRVITQDKLLSDYPLEIYKEHDVILASWIETYDTFISYICVIPKNQIISIRKIGNLLNEVYSKEDGIRNYSFYFIGNKKFNKLDVIFFDKIEENITITNRLFIKIIDKDDIKYLKLLDKFFTKDNEENTFSSFVDSLIKQ